MKPKTKARLRPSEIIARAQGQRELHHSGFSLAGTALHPPTTSTPSSRGADSSTAVVRSPCGQADRARQQDLPADKLTEQERATFGDRWIEGSDLKKVGLLGRGGCAVVWDGVSSSSQTRFAVKQVARSGAVQGVQLTKKQAEGLRTEYHVGKRPHRGISTPGCRPAWYTPVQKYHGDVPLHRGVPRTVTFVQKYHAQDHQFATLCRKRQRKQVECPKPLTKTGERTSLEIVPAVRKSCCVSGGWDLWA